MVFVDGEVLFDNVNHLLSLSEKPNSRLKFLYADLNDYSSLEDCIEKSKPNFIFHLAAQSFPQTSFSEANITLNTNIIGTYNLLNAIKRKKLIPIFTCVRHLKFLEKFQKIMPITEDCSYHPASPYAISKVGTDLIGKFF